VKSVARFIENGLSNCCIKPQISNIRMSALGAGCFGAGMVERRKRTSFLARSLWAI
jgi:hypothetical protein